MSRPFMLQYRVCSLALCSLLYYVPVVAQDTQRWGVEEVMRIGSIDDEAELLTSVSSVVVGGQTVVLQQPRDAMVRVFTTDGRPVTTFGREGDGPGEFRGMARAGWLGDTLYVTDERLRRVTFYNDQWELIETIRVAGSQPGSVFQVTTPTRLHRTGRGIALPIIGSAHYLIENPNLDKPIFRTDWRGAIEDTLATVSLRNTTLTLIGESRETYASQPFSDAPSVAVAPDASYILVVERDAPQSVERTSYRILKIGLSGDTLADREVEYTPVEVPQSVKEDVTESLAVRLQRNDPLEEARRLVEREIYLPAYYPPVTGVVAGSDGRIWIRRNPIEGDLVRWDVLSADCVLIAHLYLPSELYLLESRDDELWAGERDELGVPYLVRLRLMRP